MVKLAFGNRDAEYGWLIVAGGPHLLVGTRALIAMADAARMYLRCLAEIAVLKVSLKMYYQVTSRKIQNLKIGYRGNANLIIISKECNSCKKK